ncbi:MAG TPA: hypothetical protein P5141_07250 [Candidatus Hydrogenedentes bacterium]|nr:hypothetical protein [Candidatus Hydrogenedentota bacterium]HOC73065.1 hypothetical protein [Candidatus Hydrogenedentota bacterium]HOH51746.1 hypothetical protein [Candidatus Hydrogenedentota bacterium]HQL93659.1 hypothetical protein [Candidatus Hydrogenedentota bacterium]HRZ17344.1 hypothetical protein [Candidatus Hydrogenedentota bacterium]
MKRAFLVAVVSLVVAVGLSGCPGVACFGIDSCQIQGKWKTTIVDLLGFSRDIFLTFQDGEFLYEGPTYLTDGGFLYNGDTGTYTVKAGKRPRQLDITVVRGDGTKTWLGIYEVSAGMLQIQLGTDTLRPDALTLQDSWTLTPVN